MKRKFKLITSVASLCLAVALMAFGVYAATAPAVTVSGTVSFSASNVLANVSVYKLDAQAAAIAGTENFGTAVGTHEYTAATKDNNKEFNDIEFNLTDANTHAAFLVKIESKYATGSNVKITVTSPTAVTKTGADDVTCEIKMGKATSALTAVTDSAKTVEIAAEEVAYILVTFNVDPTTANTFAGTAWSFGAIQLAR